MATVESISLPEALQARYGQLSKPNANVRLYEGLSTIGGSHATRARAELRWMPTPRVEFRTSDAPVSLGPVPDAERLEVTFGRRQVSARVMVTSRTIGETSLVRGIVEDPVDFGRGNRLDALDFHLVNFRNYIGSFIASGSRWYSGRIELAARGWHVTIDAVPDLSQRISTLRVDGGYAVSHVGRLTRSDGSGFSARRGTDVLEAIGNLISFAKGAWCLPILPVGWAADRVVWRSWSIPRIDAWRTPLSWFRDPDPEALGRAFPEFLRLWQHPDWHGTVRRGIYLYLAANGRYADSGLVMAQACLELLAWAILRMRKRQSLDREAADNIRRLLQWCRVSPSVPPSLDALERHTIPGDGEQDGPAKVTWVRNRFTHAPRGSSLGDLGSPLITQAWRLSLWYLDLVLLRLFRCFGEFINRADLAGFTIAP
jgi:hypothetical protein